MKFCPDHWFQLRSAIDTRGLGSLVAASGEQAMSNLRSELDDGSSIDNFDPLMMGHNAILDMGMEKIDEVYGQSSLMLFADATEHPEWACPICALNWCHAEHERLCSQEGCNYPKGYDWSDELINGASDFVLAEWRKMGAN